MVTRGFCSENTIKKIHSTVHSTKWHGQSIRTIAVEVEVMILSAVAIARGNFEIPTLLFPRVRKTKTQSLLATVIERRWSVPPPPPPPRTVMDPLQMT
jgi:hypothetical protein